MQLARLSRDEIRAIRKQIRVQDPITRRWVPGKGFSLGELKEVGLAISLAKKMRIPLDKRRKSVHEANVELLRRILIEKTGQRVEKVSVKEEKPKEKLVPKEEKVEVVVPSKPLSTEEAIERVVDSVIGFLDGANRRKREKIAEIFNEAVKGNVPELESKGTEELYSILEKLLNDLAVAGLGKLSKAFFTKSKDWDVTVAREIMVESIKKILKGE